MKAFQIAPIALAVLLVGCSSDDLILQRRVDYQASASNIKKAPLDIPPDLSAPTSNMVYTLPTIATLAENGGVISITPQDAQMVRAGTQRWLVVKADPDKIWSKARDFLLSQGFILNKEDKAIGIMETDWLENRAKLPKDPLSTILSKVSTRFASTGELDRYRIRIERGTDPATVEIYLSHLGLVEAYRDNGSTELRFGSDNTDTIWTSRPSEPLLEAEMLGMLLQYIGLEEKAAKEIVNKQVEANLGANLSGNVLKLNDSFERAWRRTGLAIERTGFVIVDRDRDQGVYYVRRAQTDLEQKEEGGFFSSLAFWRSDEDKKKAQPLEYQVQLKRDGNNTNITLQAKDKVDAEIENTLLEGLYNQLK